MKPGKLLEVFGVSVTHFDDFKCKYLDIYDKSKTEKCNDAVSIIDKVDFELELIQRDQISVACILALLADALRGSERHLRSKHELLEKFISRA